MGFNALKIIGLGLGALLAIGGCTNRVHDENLAMHRQNQELQSQLDASRSAPPPPAADNSAMAAENAALKQQISDLQNKLQQPTPGAGDQPGIKGIETSYDATKKEMTVTVPGDVLFDAGSDALKPGAKATLNKVADALKTQYSGRAVRVEGHSDSDPINKTKGRWKDNLELSVARAASVTRYLASQGVPESQMVPSGFGSKHPKKSKEASRRVEIIVVTG